MTPQTEGMHLAGSRWVWMTQASRKHRQQGIQVRDVAGVLQQPALAGIVGADQAQVVRIATVAVRFVALPPPAVVTG